VRLKVLTISDLLPEYLTITSATISISEQIYFIQFYTICATCISLRMLQSYRNFTEVTVYSLCLQFTTVNVVVTVSIRSVSKLNRTLNLIVVVLF